MNKENKEILKAEAIVKEDSNQIMAYKIEDNIYIFANYNENTYAKRLSVLKKLINYKQNINLIYISDKETEEKSLVGFCIDSTLYINKKYDVSILNSPRRYIVTGSLVIKEISYSEPGETIELDFIKTLSAIEKANQKLAEQRHAIEGQDLQIKYNKDNIYELQIVLDKFGILIQECVIEDEKSFVARYVYKKNKEKISDVTIGSIINITALVCEDNVVGFIFCGSVFLKYSYDAKISRDEISSHKLDYDMQCRITGISNKSRRAASVSKAISTKISSAETTILISSSLETADPAQDSSAGTKLEQVPPTAHPAQDSSSNTKPEQVLSAEVTAIISSSLETADPAHPAQDSSASTKLEQVPPTAHPAQDSSSNTKPEQVSPAEVTAIISSSLETADPAHPAQDSSASTKLEQVPPTAHPAQDSSSNTKPEQVSPAEVTAIISSSLETADPAHPAQDSSASTNPEQVLSAEATAIISSSLETADPAHPAQDSSASTNPKQVPPTAHPAQDSSASTKPEQVSPAEVTILISSSAESLSGINSKYCKCNIL